MDELAVGLREPRLLLAESRHHPIGRTAAVEVAAPAVFEDQVHVCDESVSELGYVVVLLAGNTLTHGPRFRLGGRVRVVALSA